MYIIYACIVHTTLYDKLQHEGNMTPLSKPRVFLKNNTEPSIDVNTTKTMWLSQMSCCKGSQTRPCAG